MLIFSLFLFLIGVCIGSFLNVVIDRIPHNKSIASGRSVCDYCGHVLSWADLFPVVSFLFLSGKCRYCKKRLSVQYPLVEIATGFLFVMTFFLIGFPSSNFGWMGFVMTFGLVSNFFALAVMDSKYGILSDKLILFAIGMILVLYIFSPVILLQHFVVGVICLASFFALFLLTRGRGIGLGDVKLSFVMGLLLGFPSILLAFYLAFLTGGLVAIILVLAKKKKFVGGTIAFGPFLLLGTYISWYFGDSLWVLLLRLLGNQ